MRHRVIAARFAIVLAVMLSLGATCGRGASVQSETGPIYTLRVQNTSSRAITVSYNAGGGYQALGSVSAGDVRDFVVASPGSLSITVRARSEGASELTRTATLRSGGVTTVTF